MQIETIGIYNADGEKRLVRFHDRLNILTGWSGTGKSSLLDIVEFCLGRSQPTYPEGALTQAVAWFSTTVVHDGTHIFIARPAPGRGARSTQQAMIRIGAGADDVDGGELEVNTDAATVREQFKSRFTRSSATRTPGTRIVVRPRRRLTVPLMPAASAAPHAYGRPLRRRLAGRGGSAASHTYGGSRRAAAAPARATPDRRARAATADGQPTRESRTD